MKTAKEIISEYGWENVWTHKMMEEIINEARKQTIEACADAAKITFNMQSDKSGIQQPVIVDKKSILNLINELK